MDQLDDMSTALKDRRDTIVRELSNATARKTEAIDYEQKMTAALTKFDAQYAILLEKAPELKAIAPVEDEEVEDGEIEPTPQEEGEEDGE